MFGASSMFSVRAVAGVDGSRQGDIARSSRTKSSLINRIRRSALQRIGNPVARCHGYVELGRTPRWSCANYEYGPMTRPFLIQGDSDPDRARPGRWASMRTAKTARMFEKVFSLPDVKLR